MQRAGRTPGYTQLATVHVPSTGAALVVDVMCEAFRDYPVMRYVLGDSVDYDARLRTLVGLFVAARALREDVMLGVMHGKQLIAAATTSDPALPPHPDFAAMREAAWASLGEAARERYQHCVDAWESMAVDVPQLHVNMIGVRAAFRGTGLGRKLLSEVHAMAERAPALHGVSLTTENPRNVLLYEHLGYQVIGHTRITPELETWSLFFSARGSARDSE